MNQYEMVALIVTVIAVAGFLKHAVSVKEQQQDGRRQEDDAARDETDKRLEHIERRLQILERIVTSDGYDLKQKFKDLEKDL